MKSANIIGGLSHYYLGCILDKPFDICRCLSGCVTRRSLATLEDRSIIPGAGNNNVLVRPTRSDWQTLVSSVLQYLVFASADRDF